METEKEVLDYLRRCQSQTGMLLKFKDYFPFGVLLGNNLIIPHITMIEILGSNSGEICYFIDETGMLYLEEDFDNSLDPREVLSEKNIPDGWKPISLRRLNAVISSKLKKGEDE